MNAHEVLVLDESLAVHSDLRDAFERRGYRVHSVRDMASARRAVDRDSFGAAVFGVDWNRVDGRAGTRNLLHEAARACPVLVLSDGDRLETRISALREGATDFIAKPYDPTFVVKRVQESMHAVKTPGGPHRILVVDDSLTYGHAVSRALVRDGHDVVLATTGKEAEEYLATQSPDAIFLDVFLPDVDGIDLAKRIRSAAATRDLPILLLTGRESTTIRARAIEANVSDFAAKNTPLDDLRARARTLIDGGGRRLAARPDPAAQTSAPLLGDALFDRIVVLSGLSAVLGRSTLTLGLKRANLEPASLTPTSLAAALPQIEQVLTTFLPSPDAKKRLASISELARESEGSR